MTGRVLFRMNCADIGGWIKNPNRRVDCIKIDYELAESILGMLDLTGNLSALAGEAA